ncbi:exonuclease domain-containing protein [Actinomyces faecalis]|uniref:exonuclease domain-containing protein n=1 Tax=Actinomyces faecalis TaxID=2722820 RepID=UPI001554FA02|nr:exonuclease domain-containing protein [Actinomyces faecalis]
MSEHHLTTSWATGPFLGFDTETTGVDPSRDRLVTAALVHRGPLQADGGRSQEVLTWLADPGVPIPSSASAVHGISTERAQAEGRPAHEVLEEVAVHLATAMAGGTPVVVFNASFDLTLMEHELTRHGLDTLHQRLGGPLAPVLDPLVLDRAVDRWRKGKRRLDAMCQVYGVQVDEALHTAEVDVAATLDVLEALAQAYPEVARMSLEDLQSFQVTAHRRWAESLNDWLRRQGRVPDAGTTWPLATGC